MKKYILISSLATVALLAACNKDASKASAPAAAATPATATAAAAAPAAGSFSSAAVNDYVKAYNTYADEYIAALAAAKKGDTSKLQALGNRAQELSAKQGELAGKLTPSEAQAFSDAMMAVAKRMQDAAAK